ncbi:regulator of length of O-antigen component of lipopolysaccharide chains [plant metagenome]|uniref:Regulator of length of O-antigen component of lipopolysaccharide chains n=1 Tax=plant metagenome TaxID=1297885 RepID=A0A484SD42_9ZZZZ
MDNSHHSTSTSPRELDLQDIACALWGGRKIVASLVLGGTLVAAAYAFLSTPIYRTSVSVLPPTAHGVAQYNIVAQLTGEGIASITARKEIKGIPPLTPQDAYRVFLRHLSSDTLRQDFFTNTYLPAQGQNISENQQERLWLKLQDQLTITLPRREGDSAQLFLEGVDPQTISNWANDYTKAAIAAARSELMADLNAAVEVRRQSNERQISALRRVAEKSRTDRIQRVTEALAIADAVGAQPVPPTGNLLIDYKDETLYLRGSNALRAELEQLNERKTDDPYIPELGDMLRADALLSGISLPSEQLAVATVDRIATPPVNPSYPRKGFAIAIGAIVGLILSVLIIVLQGSMRRDRRNED